MNSIQLREMLFNIISFHGAKASKTSRNTMSSDSYNTNNYIFCFTQMLSNFLKGWWHAATLFIYFYINRAYGTCNILYIILVEFPSWSPHCFRSVEGLLWGAEPRFELGPAIQQADELLSEPRRNFTGRFHTGIFFCIHRRERYLKTTLLCCRCT